MERDVKFWIIVASKDHVNTGITKGIAQACHGKAAPLQRMRKGDFVLYYSGKLRFEGKEKCQAFTAIGQIEDEEVYQADLSANVCAFRRKIHYFAHKYISILPLIDDLQFIANKKSWGYPFRFGVLEINIHDFEIIHSYMLGKTYV